MANAAVKHHRIRAAAELLGVSIAQTYNLIARGDLAAVKLGGSSLISDAEIARFQRELPVLVSRAAVAKPDPIKQPARGRRAAAG